MISRDIIYIYIYVYVYIPKQWLWLITLANLCQSDENLCFVLWNLQDVFPWTLWNSRTCWCQSWRRTCAKLMGKKYEKMRRTCAKPMGKICVFQKVLSICPPKKYDCKIREFSWILFKKSLPFVNLHEIPEVLATLAELYISPLGSCRPWNIIVPAGDARKQRNHCIATLFFLNIIGLQNEFHIIQWFLYVFICFYWLQAVYVYEVLMFDDSWMVWMQSHIPAKVKRLQPLLRCTWRPQGCGDSGWCMSKTKDIKNQGCENLSVSV